MNDDKFDQDLRLKNWGRHILALCEFCPKLHPANAAPSSAVLTNGGTIYKQKTVNT